MKTTLSALLVAASLIGGIAAAHATPTAFPAYPGWAQEAFDEN